jgi:hypothetical protein
MKTVYQPRPLFGAVTDLSIVFAGASTATLALFPITLGALSRAAPG